MIGGQLHFKDIVYSSFRTRRPSLGVKAYLRKKIRGLLLWLAHKANARPIQTLILPTTGSWRNMLATEWELQKRLLSIKWKAGANRNAVA